MRKIKISGYLFSLSALLVIGCTPEVSPNEILGEDEEQVEPDEVVEENKEVIEEFRNAVKDSPPPDVLIQLIDDHIAEVSTENADEMIDTLRHSLENNKQLFEERLIELDPDNELLRIDGLEATFKESSINEIQNEDLQTEVEYLYANLYQLINLEGSFYPAVDYSKLKNYAKYLSEEFQLYLEIKSLELEDRTMADGELGVSFVELVERIYKAEDYLKIAVPSERKEDILEDYHYKISAYLKGLPNTLITEEGTNQIKASVLSSYRDTTDNDYEISTAVKEYLTALDANDYLVDEEILQRADALIIKALTTFDIE